MMTANNNGKVLQMYYFGLGVFSFFFLQQKL